MLNVLNPDLLQLAHRNATKLAFVPPEAAAAAGMPADPAAAGGQAAPPAGGMAPAAMAGGGMDPAAMAGGGAAAAAPPPPSGVTADEVRLIVQQALSASGGGGGGGGGKGGGAGKPKVDVGTELYQIKKILVMMAQEQGMSIPPTMLLGDPSQDPAISAEQAAQDPLSSAATQTGGGLSPLQPPAPFSLTPPPAAAPAGGEKTAKAMQLGVPYLGEVPMQAADINQTTQTAQAIAHRYRAAISSK